MHQHELLYGCKPYLPNCITQEPSTQYTYDDYVKDIKSKLNITQKIASEHIINSKNKSKNYYDKKIKFVNYKVDDLVYVLNKARTPGINKKLAPTYKGPFKITKVNQNKTVEIRKGKKTNYLSRQ